MCVQSTPEKFLTPSANIPEIVRAKVSTGHEVRSQKKICSSMTRPQDRIRRVSSQTLLTAAYFQARNLGQKSNQDEFKKKIIPLFSETATQSTRSQAPLSDLTSESHR
jgi:hypothetical protein